MKQVDKTAKIYEPVVILEYNREVIIGPKCCIGQFSFIAPRKLVMEEGAEICPSVVLGGGGDIYMCRWSCVDFGARLIPATFTTDGLYMNDALMEEDPSKVDMIRGSITLKEGAVIGSNAVICVSKRCKDIVIGEHSVVGAGSYLDHSLPSNTIIHPRCGYAGFDVKIRKRKRNE